MDLYEAFEAIVRDEEAFRGQLSRYAELADGRPQVTPRDIPPLVSQHLPSIRPTARGKMFNAELVVRRSPGQPVEPTAYPDLGNGDVEVNYWLMAPILQAAEQPQRLTFPQVTRSDGTVSTWAGGYDALVGVVAAEQLLHALEQLRWTKADYFAPDLGYLREITGGAVRDWVVIAPQSGDESRDLEGLGPRSVASRKRRDGRGTSFGALSDPKHRPPAERISGARAGWGDTTVDALAQPARGAPLLYPVVEPPDAGATARDVSMVFTLFAPAAARAANGQVVQFRARDTGAPLRPIVDAPPGSAE